MPRIKATKIVFKADHPFRKFQDLSLPFFSRITLLTGHNGVGKSTILGLLASLSGITKGTDKTYFGKQFDASIAEIVYIDHATEVAAPKAANKLAEPQVHYKIDNFELVKECSLTRRGAAPRARVVARSVPHLKFIDAGTPIGPDAKVPLPTIFLGVTRMLPVGESPDARIQNTVADKWHADDEAFMLRLVKRVIPGGQASAGAITVNRIMQTSKHSTHPKYPYGPRSVSLGQDSLGAIVTALASFYRLKRKLGANYSGGLLIIDELDASFHPHAITRLVEELRKAADELDLQIVATTHSTTLIELVHPEGPNKRIAKGKDGVLYLRNTRAPEYDPDFSLHDILDDMDLKPPAASTKPPEVKVYFEDDEAYQVFNFVTRPELLRALGEQNNVVIKAMPLGVGCSSLLQLPKKDAYFKSVVLAVDADAAKPGEMPVNSVALPGFTDLNGQGLSPERTIVKYIKALVEEPTKNHPIAWQDNRLKKLSQDNLRANLLDDIDGPMDRKAAKAWWRGKRTYLERLGLYEIWAKAHPELITAYEEQLGSAVKAAVKVRRSEEWQTKLAIAR